MEAPVEARHPVQVPEELKNSLTVPLWPTAGQMLGLSKNSAYRAANRGEIKTLRYGVKILVPTAHLIEILCLPADNADADAA